MKSTTLIGIVLIAFGVAGLAFHGIDYATRDRLVVMSGFGTAAETRETVPVPLTAGGLAMAAGVGAVAVASRKP